MKKYIGGFIMRIELDPKSLILGAILGVCFVVFRGAVSVAKDRIENLKEEEA
jgi:hypothetical protein